MNNGGDAAEQVVRLSLEGFEVAARLSGSTPFGTTFTTRRCVTRSGIMVTFLWWLSMRCSIYPWQRPLTASVLDMINSRGFSARRCWVCWVRIL